MNHDPDDQDRGVFADAFQGRLSLRLSGNFARGGVVEFQMLNHEPEFVTLSAEEWAVLAILAAGRIKSPPPSLESFFSANRLAERLAKQGVVDFVDALNAIRIVYRLRRRLNGTKTRQRLIASGQLVAGGSAGHRLVRRDPVLGYSLALDAANISLTIGTGEPPPGEFDEM